MTKELDIVGITEKFNKIMDNFNEQSMGLVPGAARPALIENILVKIDNVDYKLKAKASITINNKSSLKVIPYDASHGKHIAKGLLDAKKGTVDTNNDSILFHLPILTMENINDNKKILKEILEKAKVSILQVRKDALKLISAFEHSHKDFYRKEEKKLQDVVQKATTNLDNLYKEKLKVFIS